MRTRPRVRRAAAPAVAALPALAASAPAAPAQTAPGSPRVLTFEGLADNAQVGRFYDGGAGGRYGVSFDTSAYASVSAAAGGFGGFQGAPSGTTGLYFTAASSAAVNVAGGFGSFSLFYAAPSEPGTVSVYSGADGTGALLGAATLAVTPSAPGAGACPRADLPYCPFARATVAFRGTARSVVFGGAANTIVFDDLTFGGASAPAVVPEPSAGALLLAGLGGLAAARRRRRAA